ncbi:hypothetical protein D3C71_1031520 [compost metagenome]
MLKSHSHGFKLKEAAAGSGFTTLYVSGTQTDDGTPYIQPTGGAETRPRNVAVVMCIKAWNAPINQGNIDIAALAVLAAQATEINQGTAKIATQALTDAGVDDATIVTPKKMRFGFQFIKGINGALVLPTWLGGFIIQWGVTTSIATGAAATFNYPIAFPVAAVCPGAIRRGSGNNSATVDTTLTQISIGNRPHYSVDSSGTANIYFFFCLGY